jgi:hypothetical protein
MSRILIIAKDHSKQPKIFTRKSSRFFGTRVILGVKSLPKKKSMSNSSSPKIQLLHILSKTLIAQSERRMRTKTWEDFGTQLCGKPFSHFCFHTKN